MGGIERAFSKRRNMSEKEWFQFAVVVIAIGFGKISGPLLTEAWRRMLWFVIVAAIVIWAIRKLNKNHLVK